MKYPIIITAIAVALMAGNVSAKDYYKWVDDKGVTRYAEQPPAGVQAEKINVNGGSASAYDPSAAVAKTEEAHKEQAHKDELTEHTKKLEQEEQEKCAKVSEQKKTLTERGRVRMKDKDGNERVMTPEEQAAQIAELEKYEKNRCTPKK